jgi:cyclase
MEAFMPGSIACWRKAMRGVCLLGLLVSLPAWAAESKPFVNEQYDLVKVADGVYSFVAPDTDSGVVQANCTVIIGEDAVLVVDSGQFPTLARRMVADIRKLTSKPVRYLVNTHWHFDHVWGNGVFRESFPGLAIISTEFTRQMVEDQGPKVLRTQAHKNEEDAAQMRKMAAGEKLPDGQVVTEQLRASLIRTADTLDHIAPELALTVHTPPTLGFEKQLNVSLGKREVQLMWLGRANTGGDAVVWVPDVKVLTTGDAVVYPVPFAFGSYMNEWPGVVQKMIDLHPAVIIPGHGALQHDDAYLRTLIELFQALTSQVKDAVARNLTLEQTQKAVRLDEFYERMAGNDLMWGRAFRSAFLHPAVERAYQEATGHLKPEAEE